MEDKQLNHQESLELITKMIQNTQNKLVGNEGFYFLVWGYVTVAVSLAVGLTIHFTGSDYWHFLWFAIPALVGLIILFRKPKQQVKSVKTYIDRIVGYSWMLMGIVCFILSVCSFVFPRQIPILFLVMLLIGSGAAFTGLVIRMKAIAICGFLGMIAAVGQLLVHSLYPAIAIFALSFIIICVIPGHILYAKARKEKQAEEVHHA